MTDPGRSYSDVRDRIVPEAIWRGRREERSVEITSVDERFVYAISSRRGRRRTRISKITLLKEFEFERMAGG